ncbi:MAG: hypothetical protein H6739_31830 [Alphaproteobacteria bacterium]|nr:hypothetical protein [Alphaproteobacteria bacterium]
MRALPLIALLFAACVPEPECTEELACPFGEVCLEGTCVEIPCNTSAQCGMEEHCVDRKCEAGCSEDADCYPGDLCDLGENTCVSRGCRDTRLDCGFKEFCNEANGECYEAGGYYCKPCTSDESCGGNGNLCLRFGGGYEYCGVTCSTDDDCPAGLGCYPIGDRTGQIISFQCYTYCWLYEDADADFEAGSPPAPDLFPLIEPVCPVEEAE